ncbi:MAG TPA: hypothetical protein VE175_14340, partial [Woeseiaceae bacterium]|nr:hypothetical protein [Woeseiaceae bacterium]
MSASIRCGRRAPLVALAATFALASSSPAASGEIGGEAPFEYVVQAGHTAEIHALAYARDGRFFASGAKDSTVKLWSPNGTLIRTITTGYWVDEMAISHDSRSILAAARLGTIRLLSLEGEVLRELPRPSLKLGFVESVALSPDGRFAAIGTTARRILVYDLAGSGEVAAPLVLEAPGEKVWGVETLLFTPDGTIISGHGDGRVRFWSVQGRLEKTLAALDYGVRALALSPDGKTLATAGRPLTSHAGAKERGKMHTRLWDIDGRLLGEFSSQGTASLHFTPDGTQLVSGGYFDGQVNFYTRSGELVRTITVGRGSLVSPRLIALSPDGRSLITADGSLHPPGLKMWTADGRFERDMQSFSGAMTNVVVSPDGEQIVTLSGDLRVRVWSPTGRLLGSLEGHKIYP